MRSALLLLTLVGSLQASGTRLELIEQHQGVGSAPTAKDYAIVGAGFGLAVISVVLPIALAITLGVKLAEWMSGY